MQAAHEVLTKEQQSFILQHSQLILIPAV